MAPHRRLEELVDVVETRAKKGDRIYVEGEIEYRQYQDKEEVTKCTTEIRARDVVLLGGRDGGPSGGDYDDFQAPGLEEDDDLPF